MQMHTISQRLNGFFLLSSFIFLADTVSLKGKRLDFFGRTDTYVSLADTIPELSRFTACADLIFMNDDPSDWTAFSYIINNTVSGRSNIDLGLAGDHQQLIIYNLGKTFLISYNPTPLQWHTICMVWDGMKGMLEVFLNKKSMFVMLDQPQNLTANGTLVLGHLFKNRDDQEKSLIPSFTVSLYYFQLWDCILDSAEFMKCLGGNVVSWEDDVWLVDKIIPIADTRLRCFVSENATIEETTAVPSQQADLTTTSQITRLESQKTVNSTMMSRSMSVFETDYTTVSYSNTKSPLLETVTAPVLLKTTIPVTMTSTVDNLSTSAIITLPTERTSLNTTNNSTEIIKPLPSETTRTTEMAVTMTTESFYRSSTSNFPYTSGFTKDSVVVHPSVTETQAGITKTTFFSSTELTPMSVTSWPKDKSTDIGPLLSSTVNQQSLSSTAADIAPWFSVGQTSATTTHSSAESIIPPESVFISTSAPVDSVIPRNQTTDTLATTDIEIAFTVPSMTHSTRPIEMTPDLRTTETESTTLNVQDVSSSRVEDKISTLTPEVDSSMYFSFSTSSPLTITQRAPTVNNGETTRIDLTSEITLGPAMTETGSSPTITESYYTQSTHTGDESTLPLLSSTLDFISKAPELGLPSTDRITHLFSTTWTSRPEQTLMTSAFHGSSPNTEHSPTTTNMIIPPEESTENVATTFTDATITTDGTTDRVIATLHKLTSPGLDNLSTVSERISVSKMPECKFTTSLRKTTPLSAVTGNGLLSTPKEVVDVISTLAGTESTSTKSASAITPMEITSKIAFGDSEAPVPESTATQSISNTVAGKDITSHHLEERSTTIGTAEVSPFAPTVEATDESVQMGTTSVTISSLPGIEMLTTPLDNKTATTEGRENWLSKLSVKTTPSRSYNRTAETFNSLHTYPSHWTSDIPSEGDLISFTTSKNTETFPESLRASTTRISGTSFATTSTDRMAVSLSSGLLPPQPTGTHLSSTPVPITHMSSQPVDVSAVTSVRASEETESTMPSTLTRTSTTSVLSDVSVLSLIPMTTTSVTPLDQTVFTDHHTLPTHRDWSHTTSEATVISVKMTPPLTEAPVSSLRSPTTGVTKTTLLFPSADTVNPAPHSPACSQTLPDDTPFLSSTHVISKMPTPVVTQPTSQVEQTSSYTLSFPYTSSNDGEIHTTEASIVHQTMPSHSSANKLTTSMDGPLSQSSTHFTTTPAPTHLVTEISTLSSDKEHMTITPENKKRTTEVTEIHSSKGIFISDSQTTPSSGMTGTGFNEVTQISSHQTHLPSEIPLVTLPDGISTSAPALGSSQNTLALTSSNTVDVHASELSTSLGKTVVPSQVLTTTTVFSPESKSVNALSVYTPQTVEMIANTTFAPNSDSYSQDNSFTDTMTSGITRISNMVSTDTTLSHFLSPGTPPEVETSTSSPISESTHGFFETLSLSTTGISGDDFTVSYTERITPTLSVPYLPTALLDKTSAVTYIPIYQLSSQPVNVSAFTSKRVLDTSTIITAKSKATHPNCLKGSTVATSRPMPEMSSVSVNDSTFSSPAVSSDTSTTVGSFAASLPLVTSGTVLASQTSTLDVTPVIYARSSDPTKSSSAFTPSEMTEVPSRITSVSSSFPTESALSSLKTITTISMTGQVTPLWGNTRTSLFSSRNTEAISSIPKGTSSLYLSTIQQSSRANEATTLGILPGATNNLLSTVRSGKVTALTDTFSRTAASESMLSSTPLNNLLTSLNIQGSPSFISFRSTLEPTKSVRSTMYFSSDTKKFTSSSENISPTELRKSTASETVSSTPFSTTPPSLTAFPFSLHSTKVPTSTSKISHPPVSQMTEFPVLRTRTTSSNTQSLLMTSWNAPAAEDSQSSVATTAHIPTPDNLETDSPYALPGSLPTLTASPTSITSGDATVSSMISLSGTLPTLEISKSPSLSISSKSLPTTVTETQSTLEKTTVTITPGFTLSSDPSGTTSKTIISKVTTLPTLTWVLSTFPSRSPHATASQTPHIVSSSTMDLSEPTFLPSDTMPTQSSTNFKPVSLTSVVVGQTTPTSTEKSITTGFLTALPTSIKSTDGKTDISKSHTASSKTTLIANSKTVSPPSSFSRVSRSPPMTKHTLSVRSMLLTSPMITSAWSRIPTASASTTFVLPKSTLDTLANITTTMATVRLTHPSVTTVSPLHSSSFETTWLSSTLPFLSMETSTSLVAAVSTVSFYNIEMNFSVFDEEPSIPITSVINELAENWLDAIFQFSEFSVANLAVEIKSRDTAEEEINVDRAFHFVQREGQGMATISHVLYSCVCQVIIKAISTLPSAELISRIQSKIHGNLTHGNFTQGQMILVVTSKYVTVEKLEPGKCDADETTSKYKGTYKWSLTNPTETAQTRCIKNEDANATRMCSINIKTGKSQWEKPRFKQCKLIQGLPDNILDLANITINDENADDVAEHILNLINESPPLDTEETKIIVSKMSDISYCDEISMNLTQIILQIIDAVLEKQSNSTSNLHEVTNEILRIIERTGHKMEFLGKKANLTVTRLALAVVRVERAFEGMTFSIRSYTEGTDPEIFLGDIPLEKVLASIYLPRSLRERIPLSNSPTILFNFFGQTSLFKIKSITQTLTSYVVSASISDLSIQNLADPVVITLQHIEENRNYDKIHCAFWDFKSNNGQGGWNSSGCKVKETTVNYTVCHCDHLTHFGVLMDLSRSSVDAVNERILTLITYTGCGISSIFLGVVMVTYIAFHKLRKDHPSKILINLCTALLMLNLVFLVNSWSSSFQKAELCIATAVMLHYFLLTSFSWMGLEAVHMYFALVKVFNIYIPNYILKFCLVGWGIPAIMVVIILSVNKDLYGTLSTTAPFCWIKDDSTFYASVVAYFCLVFLMNISMFCTVLVQLSSMKLQSQKTRQKMILHDFKGTMSLTVLLGLTWGFAFFAWGPVRILFLYLFAIFNTLQGFFIFMFHCMMKESVREQWQIHLNCGWLQLENSSDGSSRYGVNTGYKKERLKNTFKHKLLTPSLKSTATCSTFNSLGSVQCTPSEISFPNATNGTLIVLLLPE